MLGLIGRQAVTQPASQPREAERQTFSLKASCYRCAGFLVYNFFDFPISNFLLFKFHFRISSSMFIQYNESFNKCILFKLLTRWSVWTLRKCSNIFFNLQFFWFSDFNFLTFLLFYFFKFYFRISSSIINDQSNGSFNTCILLLLLLTRWSISILRKCSMIF